MLRWLARLHARRGSWGRVLLPTALCRGVRLSAGLAHRDDATGSALVLWLSGHIEANHVWVFGISVQTLCLGLRATGNADSNGAQSVGIQDCSPMYRQGGLRAQTGHLRRPTNAALEPGGQVVAGSNGRLQNSRTQGLSEPSSETTEVALVSASAQGNEVGGLLHIAGCS